MNEVSSFVFKKFRSILVGKKNDFNLLKYQICFVVCRKKWFLEIKIKICVYYYKIEFNQPSCWLYFVPNLLLF